MKRSDDINQLHIMILKAISSQLRANLVSVYHLGFVFDSHMRYRSLVFSRHRMNSPNKDQRVIRYTHISKL